MGIVTSIKRWLDLLFKNRAETDFDVQALDMPEMTAIIQKCANVYRGIPYWAKPEDNVKTINFAKAVCSETARLAMMGTSIKFDGSARAEWMQQQVDSIFFQMRHWIEYGCAYGTVFIKPNGKGIDVFTPQDVIIVSCDNQDITGIIFRDAYTDGDLHYTRLEYHRFESEDDSTPYYVSNRAYVSRSAGDIGKQIPLEQTKWSGLLEESGAILKASGERLDAPLFGMFRTPQANNVDILSPLGMPIYAEALEELKDLDIAYSRNVMEIFDSEKMILADDRLMAPTGGKVNGYEGMKKVRDRMKLPHYVNNVYGSNSSEFYQEINPQLQTSVRLEGINSLLSQIGYKIGFSNGYFVFNESSGIQTATGVEAEQQRTVQFIKDVRDKLEDCLNDVFYALNAYADLYDLAPVGEYEVTYDFGDILYVRENDRARWWQYVTTGKVPAWMYFVKFEGMTEEEAKEMTAELEVKQEQLFGEE